MKNQAYRMSLLYDFYGAILTERQRDFFDLYYNDDLSLSEIAENYNISRQGVRDAIVRAENAMQRLEDKTGLIKRYREMRGEFEEIENSADRILEINKIYRNQELEDLATKIKEKAASMKDE